jgi:uncharacterized protein (DUF4415 family)
MCYKSVDEHEAAKRELLEFRAAMSRKITERIDADILEWMRREGEREK